MLPYDKTNPYDIERYAKLLIGKTFKQVLEESAYLEDAITDSKIDYSNPNQKGKLGNLLEEKYFCYKANSDQEADFPDCGVELKATCFDILKNGNISAGERLVLTMISYDEAVEPNFYKSHVWDKCKLILLIYYERNKLLQYNILYRIRFANLISPAPEDMQIIINDYNYIIDKIARGCAHELSESDTMYLGACTKGSTAAKSLRPQYYNPQVMANKRAFCFKRQYMDYILHKYIMRGNVHVESIISNPEELKYQSFQEIVIGRLSRFISMSDRDLCAHFGREYNNNKAQWTDLTYRMLGIRGNHAEEFVKANIVVKVIRLEEDLSMNESISLPQFNFMEFVKEKWEESQVYNYFSETKFFFVVFKKDGDVYRLFKSQFWNMPFEHLNRFVREGWENIQWHIRKGVIFDIKEGKDGKVTIKNNLPKKKDNPIVHIRPHATQSAYAIRQPYGNDIVIGNVNRDANMLPQGDFMTTQSFWINNNYILSQLFPNF